MSGTGYGLLFDVMIFQFIEPYFNKRFGKFSTLDIETLCIDKNPENSIGSVQKYGLRAKALKREYTILMSISPLTYALVLATGHSISDAGITRDFVWLERSINGYRRWRNVENGEWAITTMPPPERYEKKIEQGDMVPAPI